MIGFCVLLWFIFRAEPVDPIAWAILAVAAEMRNASLLVRAIERRRKQTGGEG